MDKTQQELAQLNEQQLVTEYDECISEYAEYINKNYIEKGWDDEIFYIMSLRDLIEDVLNAAKAIGVSSLDVSKLSELDRLLITQVKNSDPFHVSFERDDLPKSKWWWWLDKPEGFPKLSSDGDYDRTIY